jgi:hypothetical protein
VEIDATQSAPTLNDVATMPPQAAAASEATLRVGAEASGSPRAATDWRLLVEPLNDKAVRDPHRLAQIELSGGVGVLDVDALEGDRTTALTRDPQGTRLEFESVRMDGRDVLLLAIAPGQRRVRVNGSAAPRLSVVAVGDEIHVEATAFHVTRYYDAKVGPPPPELVGQECALCRVVIEESSKVLVHPRCGRPLHHEPDPSGGGEPRECTSCGICPACLKPIRLEPGFAFLPELS